MTMLRKNRKGESNQRFAGEEGYIMVTQEQEKLSKKVLDYASEVHSCLGPGDYATVR
jgi:hypothetical protein